MYTEKALTAVASVTVAFVGIIVVAVQESRIKKLEKDVRNKDAIARVNKQAFTNAVSKMNPRQMQSMMDDLVVTRKFESIVKDF